MFAKELLYLSDNHLTAWQWRGGKLAPSGAFRADDEGLERFADHLAKSANTPIHLLVDVIEEDFRIETIPHILGKDRKTLIQRKLNQLMRTTPYHQASLQGRETEGRRDDKLLLTGLTNEELLKPWLERIAQHKLPLAGIYSLPLLSQVLVKKLGLTAPHQLLITRHEGGLRQSYFQEGQLKFSRLTLLSAEDMNAMQKAASREASRTQQYLNSLRLLPRDQVLEIVMICGENLYRQIQPESMNNPTMRYGIVDMAAVAAKLGLKTTTEELTSELLFLHLLGRHTPAQHYATREQVWHNQLRQARSVILGATLTTLAIGAYLAATNFDQALEDYTRGEQLTREARELQAQYLSIKNTFPPTPASAEDMKSAVEMMEAVYDKDVSPEPILELLSRALDASPAIQLNQVKWQASDNASPAQLASPTPQSPSLASPDGQTSSGGKIAIGIGKPYQVVLLDAEVIPYTDSRNALAHIDHFIGALKKNASLQVSLQAIPIDVSPRASQKGSAGMKEKDRATFSVKLVLPPTP